MMTTATKPASGPIRERIGKLATVERELSDELAQLVEQRETMRQERGSATLSARLAGETVAAPDGEALALVERLASIEAAIVEARRERLGAIRELFHAEAQELEAQADEHDREREQIERKLAPHIDTLRELTGSGWQPAGQFVRDGDGALVGVNGEPVPRHYALAGESARLRERANAHRAKRPIVGGSVSGASVDELVSAVMSNPLRLGPNLADVRAWAVEAEKAERERRRNLLSHRVPVTTVDAGNVETRNYAPADPVTFTLHWGAEGIDRSRSRCSAPGERR